MQFVAVLDGVQALSESAHRSLSPTPMQPSIKLTELCCRYKDGVGIEGAGVEVGLDLLRIVRVTIVENEHFKLRQRYATQIVLSVYSTLTRLSRPFMKKDICYG